MEAKPVRSILVMVICGVIIISLGNIDLLPWWFFILPVIMLGYCLNLLEWDLNAFMVGFIAGFFIWFGGNLLFDLQYNGSILVKLANLLGVPKVVLLFVSGSAGGTLTGLAMYIGKNILKSAELPNLE